MLDLYCVCGEWKSTNSSWEFVIDVDRCGSLTTISQDMSYEDFLTMVNENFAIDDTLHSVKLSYCLPQSKASTCLAPMYIRNDRQLKLFIRKLQEHSEEVKLYVTVNKQLQTCLVPPDAQLLIDYEGEFTSPAIQRSNNIVDDESSTLPNTPVVLPEKVPLHSTPILQQLNFCSTKSVPLANEVPLNSNPNLQQSTFRSTEGVPLVHVANKPVTIESGSELPSFTSRRGNNASNYSDAPNQESMAASGSNTSYVVDSDGIYVGKHFPDKKSMALRLRMFSIRHSFEFRVQFSDSRRFVLRCVDKNCTWRFRATRVLISPSFIVRKYVEQHSCDTSLRNVNHRQASSHVLGNMVSNFYEPGKLGLKPKQIIETVRKDHGVNISYSKAWRAQGHAEGLARGTPSESYEFLPKWLHMASLKNPGTVAHIEVDSSGRFKYVFLAFGPSIRGLKLMRKVIAIDGAFLKAKFKGTLLGATAQDGNFQLYPVAFAVVDSENEASWDWFLKCLLLIVPDEQDLVFVSDRAPSIAAALSTNYPLAHHGICAFHFEKNVQTKCKDSTLLALVDSAARSFLRVDFDYLFDQIKKSDAKLAEYLVAADIRKWSRAYSPSNRYNIMTSNIAESLNAMLKESREYPIACLFETIRSTLTRWFLERREKGANHMHLTTIEVGKKLKAAYDNHSRWFEVTQVNQFEFEVKGDLRNHQVNLETRQCTCFVFDVEKIPCSHAIAAAKHVNLNENTFVSEYYLNERWIEAYSESIYPLGDTAFWEIPEHVSSFICLPPITRIPSGRPKKNRAPSMWETFYRSGSSRKSYKCGRCGKVGHNKTSCVAAI